MLCYREAAKQMIKQGKGGKIVGACSTAGFRPSGNTVAYSTSKWAVRGLTQAAALEFAKYDINVNAYAPGPVDTDMWQEIDRSLAERHGLERGVAFERSIEARSALKRAQTPEDIANLVGFLASTKARNLTGQSVLCDGGQHAQTSSRTFKGWLICLGRHLFLIEASLRMLAEAGCSKQWIAVIKMTQYCLPTYISLQQSSKFCSFYL